MSLRCILVISDRDTESTLVGAVDGAGLGSLGGGNAEGAGFGDVWGVGPG